MRSGVIYRFAEFSLDAAVGVLFRRNERVPLTPRALSLLVALLEARGQLVEKDQLLASVWTDAVVEEGSLAWHISLLRKALADGLGGRNFIETIPRRGYRFLCPVEETDRADEQRGRTIR